MYGIFTLRAMRKIITRLGLTPENGVRIVFPGVLEYCSGDVRISYPTKTV